MRKILLPIGFMVLTATLVAQTPQSMPLTMPDYFHCTVTYASRQATADTLILKGARLEFDNGVTVSADEADFNKSQDGVLKLSGNVQMTLKKK
jgi:hypothetical protein